MSSSYKKYEELTAEEKKDIKSLVVSKNKYIRNWYTFSCVLGGVLSLSIVDFISPESTFIKAPLRILFTILFCTVMVWAIVNPRIKYESEKYINSTDS